MTKFVNIFELEAITNCRKSYSLASYELFGNEAVDDNIRIQVTNHNTPLCAEETFCYCTSGISKKLIEIIREFDNIVTIEFDGYVICVRLVEADCMKSNRMCFKDFRKALSYSMEEDERWYDLNIVNNDTVMRDLH